MFAPSHDANQTEGGAEMTWGSAFFASGGGRSLLCLGVFLAALGIGQKSASGSPGVAQEAELPGESAASVAPAAAEVVEKMLVGVGGREAIAKLRSLSFEAKGTRYRTGDGVEPGKGLFKVSSYDLQAFHDLQGERMRLDYRNRIFSRFVNEVSELVLPDAGYVMGKDDAFLPPGAWAMESARRSSTARTQFFLLPHLLLKRILENPVIVQGVADAELAHQLRTEDEVFPMTVNLDVMTGDRELFSDADWLARWAAYDLAGVRHHRLRVEDEVYPIVLYVHPETGRISKLETKEHEWVRGDVSVEVFYEGWREFSGIAFPTRIRMVVAGFPAVEASLAGVQVNAPPDESLFAAPEGVSYRRNPRSAQRGLRLSQWMQSWIQVGFAKDIHWPELSAQEIAEGVHFVTVTSDSVNSLVVEQEERVVVIEGGPQDYRSEAIIEWVGRQFPDKPISHLVQSHHHVDHAGGIRPYAAVGAEIVVHERAEAYYAALFARPASVILPDKFDRQSQPAKLSAVAAGGKLRIEDPRNPVTVYPVQTIHCQDMVIVHLERANMVFNGDLRSPRPDSGAGAETEETQDGDDFNMYFYQYGLDLARTVEAYNLQPQTIVGAHGFSEPYEALTAYIADYRKQVSAR